MCLRATSVIFECIGVVRYQNYYVSFLVLLMVVLCDPATSRSHYALNSVCPSVFPILACNLRRDCTEKFKISVQVSIGKYVYLLMLLHCVLIYCQGDEDMMCFLTDKWI